MLQRPLDVALHVPVRLDDHRLVDQFKAPFRLADGFDRIGPDARRARECQADVDAQPFVDQAKPAAFCQIEPRAELAQPRPARSPPA